MNWLSLAALAVTLALFVGIFFLRKKRVNFSVVTIAALVVGIGVGVAFQGHTDYISPLGTSYLHLLLAVVAPLIIISILASVAELGSVPKLRTIGLRSVFWLSLNTLISILLTLGVVSALGLGKNTNLDLEGVDAGALESVVTPFSTVFVNFFPTNIVADISENKIIPIILFTLLFAVSYVLVANRNAEKVRPFQELIIALKAIIYKAVGFVIRLTPYAVLVLTAVATSGVVGKADQLWSLLTLLVVAFAICLVHAYVVNGVLLRVFADVNPLQFFKKFLPAQTTAFTTQSSVGTLPVTTTVLTQRIGVPAEIASFTAPLGTTIGMPGCAGIWPILIALYGVNALGINYGLGDYLVLIVLGLLVSLGTAGVPGTATITATTVLVAVGLPLELLIITLPISAIVDMARTLTNVTAAGVSATIVARQEGLLDLDVFRGLTTVESPVDDDALALASTINPAKAAK